MPGAISKTQCPFWPESLCEIGVLFPSSQIQQIYILSVNENPGHMHRLVTKTKLLNDYKKIVQIANYLLCLDLSEILH
jgi:hypothetical protein